MASGTVFAAVALARTAGRTQLEATVIRRAKLRKVHAVLERRDACRADDARGPATGVKYVAGVALVGVSAVAAAMVLGALVRTAP